jgi:hypothetical protein
MFNVLVETKNEYTSHLTNILTPLILEGLQSVYKQSLNISKNNNILKIFQSFLKAIPQWNQDIIERETERIINSSHSYGWLNDLIKATIKSNLIVLMYNPTCKSQTKINPLLYQNIKTTDFIHRVYIECARELWNNPYLLYHNYPPIEIKRNQRDCMIIIKDAIKESLRKLLPVKHILKIYLGEEIEVDNDEHFEKAMTDAEERNLTKIIQKDLANNEEFDHPLQLDLNDKVIITLTPQPNNEIKVNETKVNDINIQMINDQLNDIIEKSTSEEKTIGSKILNIINHNNSLNNSESQSDSTPLIISEIKKLTKIEPHSESKQETIDDKIKKVLQRDLATDSDLETSLNYSQEENDNKYQEIFSNSLIPSKKSNNDTPNMINKKKFFNNYLQF